MNHEGFGQASEFDMILELFKGQRSLQLYKRQGICYHFPMQSWTISVVILLVLAGEGCKESLKPRRQPLSESGLASLSLLPDETQLLCPCSEVIPIARSPMFPRVRGVMPASPELQEECIYSPRSGRRDTESLVLTVRKTTRKLAFDEAQSLSDEVKVLSRERRALVTTEDDPAQAVRHPVPFFMALVTNGQGAYRVSVAHAAAETLLIEARESITAVDASASTLPLYFSGLPERILALCR